MVISDLVTEGDLPPSVRRSVELKTRVGGSPIQEGQTSKSTNGSYISMWRPTNPFNGERVG